MTPADIDTEWDGDNSILVAATSEESALIVATAYDNGDVLADNLPWGDDTIACVIMRDADGNYI